MVAAEKAIVLIIVLIISGGAKTTNCAFMVPDGVYQWTGHSLLSISTEEQNFIRVTNRRRVREKVGKKQDSEEKQVIGNIKCARKQKEKGSVYTNELN